MSTAAVCFALFGASALLVWLVFCVYVIERHPADAERYIKLAGGHFPLKLRRGRSEDDLP